MPYVEEKFELNSSTSGVTASDGQGALWADIWDFQVPLNTTITLKPTDVFSAYLVGDDASEMPAKTLVRVQVRDVNKLEAKSILKDVLYQTLKSFTDREQWMSLELNRELVVIPDEHIIVMVNGADAATTGDTDASASHFKLVTTRRRLALS